jgi:accessory gene regulator protein AgrB
MLSSVSVIFAQSSLFSITGYNSIQFNLFIYLFTCKFNSPEANYKASRRREDKHTHTKNKSKAMLILIVIIIITIIITKTKM